MPRGQSFLFKNPFEFPYTTGSAEPFGYCVLAARPWIMRKTWPKPPGYEDGRSLIQLRDDGMIVSWINTIAINCHRRESQDEARYQALPDCGRVGIDLTPLDVAKIDVAKILQFCRPRDRILFEQQLGGLTTREIAKKQGVTETAIRIRILRARRAARARLEGRADCVSLPEFGSALPFQGRSQSRSARHPKLD